MSGRRRLRRLRPENETVFIHPVQENDMKHSLLRFLTGTLVLALFAGACSDTPVPDPTNPLAELDRAASSREVGVTFMSRNVYHGASLEPLLAPGVLPQQIPFLTARIWAAILASDFESRADALAAEIAAVRPVAVGLQEVALFRVQTPGDAAFGGTVPATDVALDYLQILLDALQARSLDYQVVTSVRNVDAEVPMADAGSPSGLSDIRLTDHDVILVRGDVEWSDPRGAGFATALPVQLGPIPLSIPRGWTSVIVEAGGTAMRFFNTHLEPFHPAVRDAQVAEILVILAAEGLPVVLLGDLNAESDDSAYGVLVSAGFEDAWTRSSDGFTCCQAADLRNKSPSLTKRIDYVLLRGDFPFVAASGVRESVHASLVGDKVPDRTDSGLWPSDHAGVLARLRLRSAP